VPAVDDYLATLDQPARGVLDHLRAVALEVAPDAEQGRSYGLAALRHRGKPLLGFLATRTHLSLFPFSPAALDTVRDRLAGFDLAKGTLRFAADRPPPDDVVRDLVRHRVAEIDS
jgi:uncharacterized protein YdhG (YjbR/CyaY superfamily)